MQTISKSQNESNEKIFIEFVDIDIDTSIWKSKKLDFFNSYLSINYDIDFIIWDDKNIWIRNLYLFVERVKNIIITKKITLIKQNLNICLRDYVLIWYIIQFINLKRKILRTIKLIINDKKRWVTQFEKKIQLIHSKTLNNLLKKRYKITNARNHHEFFEYMLNIINHVKNVNFYNVFNQLTFVYKHISIELKQIFRVFIIFTIINKFIKQLKKRKLVW